MQTATDNKGQKKSFNLSPVEYGKAPTAYEAWIATVGIPIHRGYYCEDGRTVELGWWEERQCNAAFLVLAGQEGISEVRITEIPPGATLPPTKFALDESIYVLDGRGLTTLSTDDGQKTSFEWQR